MYNHDRIPSREKVERIRQRYPVGTRVKLLQMDDPQAVPAGTEGVVAYVDDMAQIGVNWENGSSLSLIPGVDSFEVLERAKPARAPAKKRSGDAR